MRRGMLWCGGRQMMMMMRLHKRQNNLRFIKFQFSLLRDKMNLLNN